MKNKDVIEVLHNMHEVFEDLNSNETLIIADHELIDQYDTALKCAINTLEYMQNRNILKEKSRIEKRLE